MIKMRVLRIKARQIIVLVIAIIMVLLLSYFTSNLRVSDYVERHNSRTTLRNFGFNEAKVQAKVQPRADVRTKPKVAITKSRELLDEIGVRGKHSVTLRKTATVNRAKEQRGKEGHVGIKAVSLPSRAVIDVGGITRTKRKKKKSYKLKTVQDVGKHIKDVIKQIHKDKGSKLKDRRVSKIAIVDKANKGMKKSIGKSEHLKKVTDINRDMGNVGVNRRKTNKAKGSVIMDVGNKTNSRIQKFTLKGKNGNINKSNKIQNSNNSKRQNVSRKDKGSRSIKKIYTNDVTNKRKTKLKKVVQVQPSATRIGEAMGRIPIYVVDEHHEALPYWFKASNKGDIPRSGNVLVHIDGHSDLGLHSLDTGVPIFRYPSNDDEINKLAQDNDVFIMASAMAGLIDKLIYIHPSWDNTSSKFPNFKDENGVISGKIDLGIMTANLPSNTEDLCVCYKDAEGKVNCLSNRGNVGGILTDNSKCNIKKSLSAIKILEAGAVTALTDVVESRDTLILDIDEDYFGVELPVIGVNATAGHYERVAELTTAVGHVVCNLRTPVDEALVNRMLSHVVKNLLETCAPQRKDASGSCSLRDAIRAVKWARIPPRFSCKDGDDGQADYSKGAWLKFAEALRKLRVVDLRRVLEMGWCTRDPIGVFGRTTVRVCLGMNTLYENDVILHTPTSREIRERAARLAEILKVVHSIRPPSLVTLCRSSRDGYTPRRMVSEIESAILNAFTEVSSRYAVHYNEYLWGGKIGWSNRHKVPSH